MAKTLGTIKKYMNKVLAACCAVLLTFMTFLVLWQVFTRYVLNSPAAFTEELVKYREHMALTLVRDKLTGRPHQILVIFIDALILLLAIFVITIGGYKLAMSARAEFSALLGVPRTLVYSIAPISGIFIIIAQIINLYEDITGNKVEE